MKTQIKCPQCHTMATWQDNPHRPFCSERCKLLDLGQWADESYRIQGTSQELFSEEENDSTNNGKTRH
ncbi:MAG: DNA gyrase inhibitor YacG [Desulfuromonadales bacterium]|nr:DNA gyrase inhibitor YacG [Desulfuromonadales bacterium]